MSSTTNKQIHLALWPTVVFFVGVIFIYIGERAIGEPARLRLIADAVGGPLLLAGLLYHLQKFLTATDPSHKRAEKWMVGSTLVVLSGLLLYLVFALWGDKLHDAMGKSFERVDGVAAVLWPALVLGGSLPLILMQRALMSMTDGGGEAEHVELQRLRYSAAGGATVALVLVFCFAVNYVAAERNVKYDLARFRSTRPSPATVRVVENLGKPMKATLFFPSANEVREQVVPYFAELAQKSQRFSYEVLDHALEPDKAKELAATGNGLIVVGLVDDKGKIAQKETLHLGTTLESARTALSTFDGDVQKRMLQLTRPGRVAYFTVGHGERGFDRNNLNDMNKDDLRAPVGDLRSVLQSQGYEVRTLGVGQGLSTKVPGDAGIVFIAGASDHFLPEEVAALGEYLKGGGHVYVMFDTTSEVAATDLAPLLKDAGIKFHPQLLCNDEVYAVRTHQPSDHANLAAISFSSHVSVSTLSRASGRAAVILPRTGWFERDGAAPPGMQIDFTVRSMAKTWADLNNNFTFDKEEKRQVYDVAGVVYKTIGDAKEKKEMRLAVLGSVDAGGDLVLGNRANLFMVLDTVKWLMGDEAITGEVSQESDLPIVHTKSEDKLWFYTTIFTAPVLILIGGLLYTRRVRRRRVS